MQQRHVRKHLIQTTLFFIFSACLSFPAQSEAKPRIQITHQYAKGFPRLISRSALDAPLTVDADTIALWNFDQDNDAIVIDSATNPLNGTATATNLASIPDLNTAFNSGRKFQTGSVIQFGKTNGSKLNLAGLNAFSFEAIVWFESGSTGTTTLFDNGQIKVVLIDRKLGAYVRDSSGLKGLRADTELTTNTPHRISAQYSQGLLALTDNGVLLGSIDTQVAKFGPSYEQDEIILGQNLQGYLDDVRISKIARADIAAPTITLIDPNINETQTNPRPNFQINLSDAGSGIDVNSIQVTFNGIPQNNLVITNASISGQMNVNLIRGENPLEIQVSDLTGNKTILKASITANLPMTPTVVDLGGGYNTCAVLAPEGTIYCWGGNWAQQLLDGTVSSGVSVPRSMNIMDGFLSVRTGNGNICAYNNNIKVLFCWGSNSFGETGSGRFSTVAPMIAVNGSENLVQYSVGIGHSCLVNPSHKVLCWGLNDKGQVGNFSVINQNLPQEVHNLSSAASVGTGNKFSCALIQDGTVKCWGLNNYGQLGNGTFDDSFLPTQVQGITNAIELTVGIFHSCVRTSDGFVKCWGRNDYGQLGNNSTSNSNVPVTHPTLTQTLKIGVGEQHTCALDSSRKLQCWGKGDSGQLGNGNSQNSSTPVLVSNLDSVRSFSIGQGSACVIQSNLKLKCWGSNSLGQIGNNTFNNQTIPIEITFPETAPPPSFESIATGDTNQCGRRNDGRTFCWGRGELGAIGNGSYDSTLYPTEVAQSFTQLSSGVTHVCGVSPQAEVWCWGANGNGQLGTSVPIMGHSSVPVKITGVSDPMSIAAAPETVCALLKNHTILCWGDNYIGQLGNGNMIPSPVPTLVNGITNAIQIAAGPTAVHVCATLQTGQIKCWGANSHGQLGMDPKTFTSSNLPVTVPNISNAIQVSVNGEFTCVVVEFGKVKCFGSNQYGQLGNGTTLDSATPVEVYGIKNAIQLVTGTRHACVVTLEGQTKCWGYNVDGQLGIGTTQNSSVPVLTSDELHDLHAGSYYTCGFDSQNRVRCWGWNPRGQFGNGTQNSNLFPLEVGF